MSAPNDDAVTVTKGVPALILQRVAAATAGFRPERDHWILVSSDGASVRRVEKTAGQVEPPRAAADEYAFVVTGTGEPAPPRARIVGMRIDIEKVDGTVRRDVPVPVENLDALFFGEGAVDKFVVPYYCSAFSVEYGMKLSRKWHDDPSIVAFCHTPWSVDCSTDDDGEHAHGTMTVS